MTSQEMIRWRLLGSVVGKGHGWKAVTWLVEVGVFVLIGLLTSGCDPTDPNNFPPIYFRNDLGRQMTLDFCSLDCDGSKPIGVMAAEETRAEHISGVTSLFKVSANDGVSGYMVISPIQECAIYAISAVSLSVDEQSAYNHPVSAESIRADCVERSRKGDYS